MYEGIEIVTKDEKLKEKFLKQIKIIYPQLYKIYKILGIRIIHEGDINSLLANINKLKVDVKNSNINNLKNTALFRDFFYAIIKKVSEPPSYELISFMLELDYDKFNMTAKKYKYKNFI
jgi:hypothetical protein